MAREVRGDAGPLTSRTCSFSNVLRQCVPDLLDGIKEVTPIVRLGLQRPLDDGPDHLDRIEVWRVQRPSRSHSHAGVFQAE